MNEGPPGPTSSTINDTTGALGACCENGIMAEQQHSKVCNLGPFPPKSNAPVGRATRLAIEIAENDNGQVQIRAFKVSWRTS